MNSTLIPRILQAYGLSYRRTLPAQKGYRNESHPVKLTDGQYVNLLLYKIEPGITQRITRANNVSNFLARQGYPARSLYDSRVLEIRAGERRKYACVYHYLPGSTIPWEAYTQAHIKMLGKSMGDMHALLRTYPSQNLPHVTDEYNAIVHRMQTYFADKGVIAAIGHTLSVTINTAVLPRLQTLLAACQKLPHAQPLHMDFVRGNILFDDTRHITGVLDFEKTAIGHPAFDIARTLAFLLVDCKYKSPQKVRKYFLHSGYQKRGATALPPPKLIDTLVPLFLLYDFYKFLRHNPYESLSANEHYTRTRDMLLSYRLLTVTPRHSRAGGNPIS